MPMCTIMEEVPIINAIYTAWGVGTFSDDYGSASYGLLAAVDLSAGRSCDVVWCRRHREETR